MITQKENNNEINLLPILIIPGFMSSGLEVKKSNINKNWEGKRLWLNLKSLGFESILKDGTVKYSPSFENGYGGAGEVNQKQQQVRDDYYKELNDDGHTADYENQKQQQQMQCVNQWLQHICLEEDMCSEHKGIEVRPIEGLEGVDYLTPGALTNHLSYVFGPVIKALQSIGYTNNKNLDAAPYDWRLSPMTLEKRDEYFSKIILSKVEKLYNNNTTNSNKNGVVLLCHSLGCKTGHYFLNWAKQHKGQNWIDKYIHTYIPVGGPHLGAPKALRATVDGDKMGLDAFLSDDEGLALGRSLGSGPWLMPSYLPSSSPSFAVPPNAYLRKDGIITITLGHIDFAPFFKGIRDPTKLRIAIFYGKEMLSTSFKSPINTNATNTTSATTYNFSDRFIFTVPYSPSSSSSKKLLDPIKIIIYEPGLGFSRRISKTGPYYSCYCCPLRSSVNILMCPIKYICCCPCLLLYRTLDGVFQAGAHGTDVAGGKLGGATILASSSKIHLSRIFSSFSNKSNEIVKDQVIKVSHVNNTKGGAFRAFFRKQTYVKIKARINWQREPCVTITNNNTSISKDIAISVPSPSSTTTSSSSNNVIVPYHPKDPQISYDAISGNTLLKNEGLLPQIQNHLLKCYESDPIGPRTISSINAPPVKNVVAIYGINLPTEVSVVYKRANVLIQGNEQKVHKLHNVDTNAQLRSNCYKISNGIILETKDTPQQVFDNDSNNSSNNNNKKKDDTTIVNRSGDGTVPFWSLQHCRTWQSHKCDVKVHEIEHAEHREILADLRFHNILIDYVKL